MKTMSAADLVWVATASLTKENPERTGFSRDEIRRRACELEPDYGFDRLYLNAEGSYRLYRLGDPGHPGRKDPILALLGVGQEMWQELGGGQAFIRELREDWYGAQAT
jgi:hypothetical protein